MVVSSVRLGSSGASWVAGVAREVSTRVADIVVMSNGGPGATVDVVPAPLAGLVAGAEAAGVSVVPQPARTNTIRAQTRMRRIDRSCHRSATGLRLDANGGTGSGALPVLRGDEQRGVRLQE